MSFRFFGRMSLAPGISLNLSKSEPSLSLGSVGAKLTVCSQDVRTTFGIPGTGLYYTSNQSRGTYWGGALPDAVPQPQPLTPHLDLGFFEHLLTVPEEQNFVIGLRELVGGNKDVALTNILNAAQMADGAFMAGWLCLEKQDFFRAERYLGHAITHESEIGKLFEKYGISPQIELSMTDELTVHLTATPTAARIAIIEVFQLQQRWDEAVNILKRLQHDHPEDPVIRLSLVELLMHIKPNDPNTCDQVVRLSDGIVNEPQVHAAILLYRARALRGLGMPTAALDMLSDCLKEIKDYPNDLTHALRYERALACEDAGQAEKCRVELEKLHADAPDYEDVAMRLGIR